MKTTIQFLLLALLMACSTKQSNQVTREEGSIMIDSIELKFVKIGQGDPLVVVGSAAYYSKAFSENLLSQYQMYFIDSRHFIPSYTPSENELESYTLSTWADDIEKIRKELKLKEITLIGHSVHAQIVMEYAHQYPEGLSRLVLIGGGPYASSAEFRELKDALWEKEADENRKKILEHNLAKWDSLLSKSPPNEHFVIMYDLNAPLYWMNPAFDASDLLSGIRTSPTVLQKLYSVLSKKEEVIQKLKDLNIPSLVVHGKLDFGIPYTAWEQLLSEVNNEYITYALIENASHNPQTEDISAKEFDEILTSWISKN